MSQRLTCLSIRLGDAPAAIVERLCAGTSLQTADGIRGRIRRDAEAAGVLVLRTCERFEVYAAAADAPGLVDALDVPAGEIRALATMRHDSYVTEHLLRVTAGLESRILGEPQILAQVRTAYLSAVDGRRLSPVLSALGRAAICAGRRVRRETTLGRHQPSLPQRVAQSLADRLAGRPEPVIAIIGTGALAVDVHRALHRAGLRRTRVVSREHARAVAFAAGTSTVPFSLDGLDDALAGADAVVACSAQNSFVLGPPSLAGLAGRRLAVVDLAVPRSVDPLVAALPGVMLMTLDVLSRWQHVDGATVRDAERIIREECARFEAWRSARPAAARIAHALRDAESCEHGASRLLLHERIMRMKAEAVA